MKVKICGIKEVGHAQAAIRYGVDAIGIVFAPSRRQVSVDTASQIASAVCRQTDVVGVFVDEKVDAISKTVSTVGLDWVQLHGNETPFDCRRVREQGVRVIKAFPVTDKGLVPLWEAYEIGIDVDLLLLDTSSNGQFGGSGKTFDWGLLEDRTIPRPICIAGGLNCSNVARAIELIRPDWVDVSSGVEVKGRKCESVMQRFIEQVKRATKSE